jgi:hypothetical protein
LRLSIDLQGQGWDDFLDVQGLLVLTGIGLGDMFYAVMA